MEINILQRNPAVLPDMNSCNSCGSKTLKWGEDCVVSVLHEKTNPPVGIFRQLVE